MIFENIFIFIVISFAALYMYFHLRKEIQSAKKGKCGSCPLSKKCSIEQNGNIDCAIPLSKNKNSFDPHHR